MSKITKKLVKEYLRNKLSTNDTWALHALEKIYANQTDTEQSTESTNVYNDIGFTGVDAAILSSFAKQYQQRHSLSPKQMVILRKKMKKYHHQILQLTDMKKLYKCMIKDGVIDAKDVFVEML